MKEKLIIENLVGIKPIKFPPNAFTSEKKMHKYLLQVETAVNRLIKGSEKMTKRIADELVARPTFTTGFQNIRGETEKVVFLTLASDLGYETTRIPYEEKKV